MTTTSSKRAKRWKQLTQQAAAGGHVYGGSPSRQSARAWFSSLEQLMTANVENGLADDYLAFPAMISIGLAVLFGELASGRIPGPVVAITGRGRPRSGFIEQCCIGWAIAYLNAVASHRLVDRHPIKSIQICFGVSRTTVRRWRDEVQMPRLIAAQLSDPSLDLANEIHDAGSMYQIFTMSKKKRHRLKNS